VHFSAETGQLNTEAGHIRWYIDYNYGIGYVEEPSALNQTQWSKDFANGTYPVKMWVLFANPQKNHLYHIQQPKKYIFAPPNKTL
jgi:hypothetical protein